MRNPITFHAKMMGDIMYLQQALKQPDAKEFVQAVIKEVNGHLDFNNWMLQKQSNVPEDVQIVPSVWSLWCKRDLTTNEVKSHKARLNLHGGSKSTEWTILRHTPPLWHGLPSGLWSSPESFSFGPFNKGTSLWLIYKLQSRWTSISSCHKGFKLSMGTPKNMFWS